MTNEKSLLYIYILGHTNKQNFISGMVPYRINEEELFYGPCKVDIREEIKLMFDVLNRDFSLMPNIFLIGINPAKKDKKCINNPISTYETRKILFVGKISNIFTFKEAWIHYNQIKNNHFDEAYKMSVTKMVDGVKIKDSIILSPLFVKPNNITNTPECYEHQTDMHKDIWIQDLLTQSEWNCYKRKFTSNNQNRICKDEEINFGRDCCFKMKNLHFSSEKECCPIPLDDEMVELIKIGLKDSRINENSDKINPPDIYSPFGYTKTGEKYGRLSYVKLVNNDADKFIKMVIKKKNEIYSREKND